MSKFTFVCVSAELCSDFIYLYNPTALTDDAKLCGVRPSRPVVSKHKRNVWFSVSLFLTDDERRRPDVFSALKLGE